MLKEKMFKCLFHNTKVIEKSGRIRIGKVDVYESEFDSGVNEACIWLDDDLEPGILRESDIESIEIFE